MLSSPGEVSRLVQAVEHPFHTKLYATLLMDEFSERELAKIFDREELHISLHLKYLENFGLVESNECEQCDRSICYQACSHPIEEIRSYVQNQMDGETDFWQWLRSRRLFAGIHRPRGF